MWWPVTGLFAPKTIRSRERKFQVWNFRSLELSLPGTFVPWNFRSLELSFLGTFAPWDFRSLELSFLRMGAKENKTKVQVNIHKSFLSDLYRCNYRSLSGDRWLKSHYRYDVALFNNTCRPMRAENRNLRCPTVIKRNYRYVMHLNATLDPNGADDCKNTRRYRESKSMRYRKSKLTCFSIVSLKYV